MPMYDFKCSNPECKNHRKPVTEIMSYDELVKIDRKMDCPECGQTMKNIIGKAVFKYGGAGFYGHANFS